jgi:hypothetical protein
MYFNIINLLIMNKSNTYIIIIFNIYIRQLSPIWLYLYFIMIKIYVANTEVKNSVIIIISVASINAYNGDIEI